MDVESHYLDDLIKAIVKTTQLEMIDITSDGKNISINTADVTGGKIVIQVTPLKSTVNKKYTSTRLLNEAARLRGNKEFWHNEVYITATPNNDGYIVGVGLHRRIYLDGYRKPLYKKSAAYLEENNK